MLLFKPSSLWCFVIATKLTKIDEDLLFNAYSISLRGMKKVLRWMVVMTEQCECHRTAHLLVHVIKMVNFR